MKLRLIMAFSLFFIANGLRAAEAPCIAKQNTFDAAIVSARADLAHAVVTARNALADAGTYPNANPNKYAPAFQAAIDAALHIDILKFHAVDRLKFISTN